MPGSDHQSRPVPPVNGNVWLTIAVILVLGVVGWWQNQNSPKPVGNVADPGAVVNSSSDDGDREPQHEVAERRDVFQCVLHQGERRTEEERRDDEGALGGETPLLH